MQELFEISLSIQYITKFL
jgi:bis(5'-adenosyl)-triphosphatase